MTLFRKHRGGLEDSLKTTVVIKNIDELKLQLLDYNYKKIKIFPYPTKEDCFDSRIGWHTHAVCIDFNGDFVPVGFLSDGLIGDGTNKE